MLWHVERRVLCSAPLYIILSRPVVTFGNETWELNVKNYGYKYDNYTRSLVRRSLCRSLRSRLLLSDCSISFLGRLVCTKASTVLRALAVDSSLTVGVWRSLWLTVLCAIMRKALDWKRFRITKWKPYPRVVSRKPRLVKYCFIYMKCVACGKF
jgi:hypothetical protein